MNDELREMEAAFGEFVQRPWGKEWRRLETAMLAYQAAYQTTAKLEVERTFEEIVRKAGQER